MASDVIIPALLIGLGLAIVTVVAYWQLIVAEGAYLGRGMVTLLYDLFAPRYDAAKQFDPAYDALMLAEPIVAHNPAAAVLDVAAGTGRLPMALFARPDFAGTVTALDASAPMLDLARRKLAPFGGRVTFAHRDAQALPFDADAFDVVTCLESLEFFPDAPAALREMRRVLRPGGLLLVSNRIGPDAWKLPGRARPTPDAVRALGDLGFTRVQPQAWLVDYDLISAIKSLDGGALGPPAP